MNEEKNLPATQPVQQFDFFNPVQFETMQRVCKMFANSELVPDMYKITDKNPIEKAMANCMIAIEMAQRVGASPLMIMQNMIIIYGRPSWSSKFLIATVNTCGRFNPLQYRFTDKGALGKVNYTEYVKTWIDPTTPNKRGYYKTDSKTTIFDGTLISDIECIAFTTAKGSDKVLESSPVSIRLAVQEGWYTKAGSKWQTMAKQMLMYRAASFWTNAYAPELSMGMKTDDEVRDIEDVEFEDVTTRVKKEISQKANAGEPMSFDNGTIGNDSENNDTSFVVDRETGEIKEPGSIQTGNESPTQPPAAPRSTQSGNRQQKMPGF
ncbi:MAG: hypothetical protein LBI60_05795 [Bacteroidales bacterium]|jgi:hypothetical protein|nr:hypothetical protein [Bacteroidales bacterium]